MNMEEIILSFKNHAVEIEKYYEPDKNIADVEDYNISLTHKVRIYMIALDSYKQELLLGFNNANLYDNLEHLLNIEQSKIYLAFIERFKRA